MIGLLHNKIELVEYTDKWIEYYKIEKKIICNLLEVKSISHIGSTSIKNIIAKPIIDIAIELYDIKNINKIAKKLGTIGYEYRGENGIKGRAYFIKKEDSKTLFHIHAYLKEDRNYENHLLFRDYLKANSNYMDEYTKLKILLKKRYGNDREKYTKGKAEFINKILVKAKV